MSLFGDLPSVKHEEASPAAGPLPFRKRALLAAPTSILRSKGAKRARDGVAAGPAPRPASEPLPAFSHSLFAECGPIEDEYDPARPNDYEKVKQERERRRIEAETEAKRQADLMLAEEVRCGRKGRGEVRAQTACTREAPHSVSEPTAL